jgi:hypothetical protein
MATMRVTMLHSLFVEQTCIKQPISALSSSILPCLL